MPATSAIVAAPIGLSSLTSQSPPGLNTSVAGPSPAQSPFSELLSGAVGQAAQLDQQAQEAVEGLMTGTGVDVHQAMIAAQKADMAFELALAVRNKAIQAYQAVIGMQF